MRTRGTTKTEMILSRQTNGNVPSKKNIQKRFFEENKRQCHFQDKQTDMFIFS